MFFFLISVKFTVTFAIALGHGQKVLFLLLSSVKCSTSFFGKNLFSFSPFPYFPKPGVSEWEKCICIFVTKMNPSEHKMTRITPEYKSLDPDNSAARTTKLRQSKGKLWWCNHGPVVPQAIQYWVRKYKEYRKEAAKAGAFKPSSFWLISEFLFCL